MKKEDQFLLMQNLMAKKCQHYKMTLKKIFIKTFGCQMNEYDSNRIYDSVKKIGYEKTENYEDANCYLLNTCHIRDKACLLYTSPSPRDATLSRMPSSA